MLSQIIPCRVLAVHPSLAAFRASGDARLQGTLSGADRVLLSRGRSGGRLRSCRLALFEQARRQGPRFDPGAVPLGSHAGWVRRSLCPPLAGRGGTRLWWQRAVEGDRHLSRNASALLAGTRHLLDRADGHERDPQGRSGGADQFQRGGEGAYGDFLGCSLRRTGTQIPNLGAEPLPFAPRRGQSEVAHNAEANRHPIRGRCASAARSTGMNKGRSAAPPGAAGGPARHLPVLRERAIEALAVKPGGLYLDATFGAGGYTQAILATEETRVIALDRDPSAIAAGAAVVADFPGRLKLIQTRFGDLGEAAEAASLGAFDGIVLDIGVSSLQLDKAERGFSFRFDGPLDMRMEKSGRSAADLINEADEVHLADILFHYGEERLARKIARAIVSDRKSTPFTSTKALADLVGRIVPHKPTDIHPATRTFQALRIAVNDELGELVRALKSAERVLKAENRLVVVTFHSLEDRIAKQFFATRSGRGRAASRLLPGEIAPAEPTFIVPDRQPILPDATEIAANPRARSAKLRFGIRTSARPQEPDTALRKLASLPDRARSGRR